MFVEDYQPSAVAHAVRFCITNLGWELEEVTPPEEVHQWAVVRTREPARAPSTTSPISERGQLRS